jgi:hypothetical protein
MSQYTQQNGIDAARRLVDDWYDSKFVSQFTDLQGEQDGQNKIFTIPGGRLVVHSILFPQAYNSGTPLTFNTDYTVPTPKNGQIVFATAPPESETLAVDFNYTWFDDLEWDNFLTLVSKKIGLTSYYVGPSTVAGSSAIPAGGASPADIPDGLFDAICQLAAALAAEALAQRFATKYDLSAGDQSFSPSQMAEMFDKRATKLEKGGLNARDDFYKGQGRQYSPSLSTTAGFVLPPITPPR